MAVEIDINYEGELHCRATHGPSKQTLATDAPVDNGGRGEAFSPTDLVAGALGTCLVTIMGLVARHSDLDITGTRVHVVKEMSTDPVRRIGKITVRVTLPKGKRFSQTDRARLEQAARACPVMASLHPNVSVVTEFVYPE
jgi:putative redox protein